jgi:hypothetical protein
MDGDGLRFVVNDERDINVLMLIWRLQCTLGHVQGLIER